MSPGDPCTCPATACAGSWPSSPRRPRRALLGELGALPVDFPVGRLMRTIGIHTDPDVAGGPPAPWPWSCCPSPRTSSSPTGTWREASRRRPGTRHTRRTTSWPPTRRCGATRACASSRPWRSAPATREEERRSSSTRRAERWSRWAARSRRPAWLRSRPLHDAGLVVGRVEVTRTPPSAPACAHRSWPWSSFPSRCWPSGCSAPAAPGHPAGGGGPARVGGAIPGAHRARRRHDPGLRRARGASATGAGARRRRSGGRRKR